MRHSFLLLLLLLGLAFGATAQIASSPSKHVSVSFRLVGGKPAYSIEYKGLPVVLESFMGVALKQGSDLASGFLAESSKTGTADTNWKPVMGEQSVIRNHYNELSVSLVQKPSGRKLNIVFRVFDQGVAFRYEFPKQKDLNYFVISAENTQFNLAGNHKAFWLPADWDSQEYVFNETSLSEINVDKLHIDRGPFVNSVPGGTHVQTPLQMKTANGLYLNIFEAAVVNYPVMHLRVDTKSNSLASALVPNAIGDMAYLQAPCVSPWRTVMVSDDARDIASSKMILNLNEPCRIDDTSWIRPMKYIGIWWEMHVGKTTWNYWDDSDPRKPNGKHGATTENARRYIDFAAKHGFDGVLVEGWNEGWEEWFEKWKEEVFDFVTPYPDFDIGAVADYAKSKGVRMIMHHETSGSVANYERRLDRAFSHMQKYGYPAVKTGYVGRIIPRGEFHDGQAMVNHFQFVARRAADFKLMVNSHESARPSGFSRTYPNYIAAEAARGNEFNAWSTGNPPAHETILPFTRLLGGPMDYTPGIFEIKMSVYDPNRKEQVHTTLAKQLALYVTLYSPLQMAADLPENYEKHLDAFQFIKDVALDWDESLYLEAEPGDYLTVARKARDSGKWFLGAITDENARKTTVTTDFLPKGHKYKATIYEDAKDAHWEDNPKAYRIRSAEVTSKSKINLNLAAGGGTAISFEPLK